MIVKVKRILTEEKSTIRKYEVEYWRGKISNIESEIIEERELMEKDP